MSIDQLQRESLALPASEFGQAVYNQVREALVTGAQRRSEIVAILTEFYTLLGDQGREDEQDAIAEVLDSLEGFCSPTAAL